MPERPGAQPRRITARSDRTFRAEAARAADHPGPGAGRRAGHGHTVVRLVPDTGETGVNGSLALVPQPGPPRRRGTHLSVAGGPSPPREAAEATVRLVIEVLAGTRPPRHLAGRAVPGVWRGLAAHQPQLRDRLVAPPRILRTWSQSPAPGTVETGAVVVLNGRVHALALRLDLHRGRWRCTAVETTVPAARGRRTPA